jgi:YD repeat-containing protein
MIKADFDYSYEYDQYGNLTKIGDKVLTYNKNNNKLLSVGGKSITYEGFYPKTYDGATYTFKYNNLASYVKNGLTISFEYDENNLRRKKIINGVTTKYYYDSRGNLISQEGDQLFDFLYDEHNQLYGFILNNLTKYYYVRNAFQNILGICGQNGELVVKYRYSSFGQYLAYW